MKITFDRKPKEAAPTFATLGVGDTFLRKVEIDDPNREEDTPNLYMKVHLHNGYAAINLHTGFFLKHDASGDHLILVNTETKVDYNLH